MEYAEWLRAAGTVFGIAMLPILELKAAIPVGLAMGLPLWETFFIALLGASVPVPFILLLLRPFFAWCKRTKWFKPMAEKLESRFHRKSASIRKYSLLGLFVFVAVPIPTTGVWTGSGIAALLDLRMLHALPAIILGNAVAGLILLAMGAFVMG